MIIDNDWLQSCRRAYERLNQSNVIGLRTRQNRRRANMLQNPTGDRLTFCWSEDMILITPPPEFPFYNDILAPYLKKSVMLFFAEF